MVMMLVLMLALMLMMMVMTQVQWQLLRTKLSVLPNSHPPYSKACHLYPSLTSSTLLQCSFLHFHVCSILDSVLPYLYMASCVLNHTQPFVCGWARTNSLIPLFNTD